MQNGNPNLDFLKKHRGEQMRRANNETESGELKVWREKQHGRVTRHQNSLGESNGRKE